MFGSPLAKNQLIQYDLANMETEISLALQACLRVGRLKDENKLPIELISLVNLNLRNVEKHYAMNLTGL